MLRRSVAALCLKSWTCIWGSPAVGAIDKIAVERYQAKTDSHSVYKRQGHDAAKQDQLSSDLPSVSVTTRTECVFLSLMWPCSSCSVVKAMPAFPTLRVRPACAS